MAWLNAAFYSRAEKGDGENSCVQLC